MSVRKRRYTKEEFARRGDAIYENQVRPNIANDDEDKFAAIDIESADYEVGVDELETCDRLRSRVPDPQIWMVRIGSRSVHRFGGQEVELRFPSSPYSGAAK